MDPKLSSDQKEFVNCFKQLLKRCQKIIDEIKKRSVDIDGKIATVETNLIKYDKFFAKSKDKGKIDIHIKYVQEMLIQNESAILTLAHDRSEIDDSWLLSKTTSIAFINPNEKGKSNIRIDLSFI